MSAQADDLREALRRLDAAIARHEALVKEAAAGDAGRPFLKALANDLRLMREEAARLRRLLLAS